MGRLNDDKKKKKKNWNGDEKYFARNVRSEFIMINGK